MLALIELTGTGVVQFVHGNSYNNGLRHTCPQAQHFMF